MRVEPKQEKNERTRGN